MVWKVFFVIAVILVFLMNVIGYNSDYSGMSGIQYVVGLLFQVGIAFILGIFYSLGWKQQLFSKKSTNIFLTVFIISMVLFPIISVFQVYPVIYAQVQDSVVAIISSVIGSSIVAVVVNLFFIPFYVGLYKYKKNIDTLTLVDKPYWKMLSLYCVPVLAGFVTASLTKYTHFALYNIIDYYVITSCIYEIIFMIGFSWRIRIFHKLFWQITAVPYILFAIMTPFLMSDTFNQDFHIKEIIFCCPASMALLVVLSIVYIYVIYMYAYKEEI